MNGVDGMDAAWREVDEGALFMADDRRDTCLWDRLEMLLREERARKRGSDVLLPHESIATLSDEDAELLQLPERNPYAFSIQSQGDLGHNDLHYRIEVLRGNGLPYINPRFCGAFLHIDRETVYRLSLDQYQILCLTQESNQRVPSLPRQELQHYNLIQLSQVQKYAKAAKAKLQDYLSEENNKVIVPARLDIAFKEEADDSVRIAPILLEADDSGRLTPVDTEEFQEAFAKSRLVRGIYKGRDRSKSYVCSPAIKDGLQKIQRTKPLNKADKERFQKQPKELFPDQIFCFDSIFSEEKASSILEKDLPFLEKSEDDWLPAESSFEDDGIVQEEASEDAASDAEGMQTVYSDRVKGLADIQRPIYYGSGHKTDWLQGEGEACDDAPVDESSMSVRQEEKAQEEETSLLDLCADTEEDAVVSAMSSNTASVASADSMESESPVPIQETPPKARPKALDIKANFENVDYDPNRKTREGRVDPRALRENIRLLTYQEDGVEWLFQSWAHGYRGLLLADDMGLGKTLQTLAFIAGLKKDGGHAELKEKPILIVAPNALLENWQNEYKKFVADDVFSAIIPLHGTGLQSFATGDLTPNGKKKLQIRLPQDAIGLTTYETLRDYQFSFAEIDWGMIVIDEAQKIKNPFTGVTKALKAMQYDYAVCLTGTPVENSWVDLWSIMDFVQPAKLGDLKTFQGEYIAPLKQLGEDREAIENLGRRLKERLAPLFLRRMKKDKLDGIPKKHIFSCPEEMPEYQKRCYMAVLQAGRQKMIEPLMMIAKLRDISLHPDLGSKQAKAFYAMEPDAVIGQSARLIRLFAILEEIRQRGEKALIFLVSHKMQLILRHLLQEKFNMQVLAPVNGNINGASRQKIVDRFRAAMGFQVLILSPEAAGVGFTITEANNVIHLSRCWNPAKEDQATDRVYRIGQKKEVNVYLPIARHKKLGERGSFDEKLDALLSYKRKLSENVLFPTEDNARDGLQLFDELTGAAADDSHCYHWAIEDLDSLTGKIFERVIADLYDEMPQHHAQKTPDTNDYGADVVVLFEGTEKGLLIQCKHAENPRQPLGNNGIQEIVAAVNHYKREHQGVEFTPLVVTNANDFTAGAKKLAKDNKVELVTRAALASMLEEYPLVKQY